MLTYLSLGAGVQSSALYVCAALGLHGVPRADVAIFADTGDEPPWVYEQVERLRSWGFEHDGPRIDTVSAGVLSEDVLARHKGQRTRFAALPVWTTGADGREAMLRRQCTREYKIAPIEKHVRKLLGFVARQRIKPGLATALIGISYDEVGRMRPSRTPWITNRYPLVDARLRRQDCIRTVIDQGLPEPQKSACFHCPFRDDAAWIEMRDQHPALFSRAVSFDVSVRDMSKSGVAVYLHRSLKPLDQASFRHDGQQSLTWEGECEGMCGV